MSTTPITPSATPTTDQLERAYELDVTTPERFAVVDARTANWVLSKIAAADRHVADVKAWAQEEVRRAEDQKRFFESQYGAQLEEFAARALEERRSKLGRRAGKSIPLPCGTIGFRTQSAKPRLHIEDEDVVLAWCREHLPQAVRVVEKLVRSEVQEHFATTGDIPDGCAIDSPTEQFFIRTRSFRETEEEVEAPEEVPELEAEGWPAPDVD